MYFWSRCRRPTIILSVSLPHVVCYSPEGPSSAASSAFAWIALARRPRRCPALELVWQVLYVGRMSRSASLPPIRVAPETKARLQAVLRDGESLTQFIESAFCREAEFRAEKNAALSRAEAALSQADKGLGMMTAEDFLAGMEQRAQSAKQRIQKAVAIDWRLRAELTCAGPG